MRRMAGNLLIGLAVLGAAGAVLMAGGSIVEMLRTYPTSDRFAAAEGGLLFAGALLGLAAILFLTGRSLRQPRPDGTMTAAPKRRRRWLPLAVYLVGSVGIGLAVGFGVSLSLMNSRSLRPLVFLLYPPTFFTQLLLGGILGYNPASETTRQAILVAANPVYFAAFFYPVYRMVVMDRAVEVARYRRMKTILILFGSVHLLIGLALASMLRA